MGPRPIADAHRSGTGAFVDSDVLSEQAKVTRKDMDYYKYQYADGTILTLYNIGKVRPAVHLQMYMQTTLVNINKFGRFHARFDQQSVLSLGLQELAYTL